MLIHSLKGGSQHRAWETWASRNVWRGPRPSKLIGPGVPELWAVKFRGRGVRDAPKAWAPKFCPLPEALSTTSFMIRCVYYAELVTRTSYTICTSKIYNLDNNLLSCSLLAHGPVLRKELLGLGPRTLGNRVPPKFYGPYSKSLVCILRTNIIVAPSTYHNPNIWGCYSVS